MPVWNSSGSSSRTRNWLKPRFASATNVLSLKMSGAISVMVVVIRIPPGGKSNSVDLEREIRRGKVSVGQLAAFSFYDERHKKKTEDGNQANPEEDVHRAIERIGTTCCDRSNNE